MTTTTGTLLVLAIFFAICLITTVWMWLAAAFSGWKFIFQPSILPRGNWNFRPLDFGFYNTPWYNFREYGDGKPDPRKPGHKIAPNVQKRNRQIGFSCILIKFSLAVAISKDESRSLDGLMQKIKDGIHLNEN